MSDFLKLNWSDFAKGLVLAVIVAFIGVIEQALTAHGFDFGAYDWSGIVTVCLEAFGAYLAKNLLSDSNGAVLGAIGGQK